MSRKPRSANLPHRDAVDRSSRYEIRVRGPLGPTLLEAFPDLTAHRLGEDTILSGTIPDQSALYGVLLKLEGLGLELLEVRGTPSTSESR